MAHENTTEMVSLPAAYQNSEVLIGVASDITWVISSRLNSVNQAHKGDCISAWEEGLNWLKATNTRPFSAPPTVGIEILSVDIAPRGN